MLVLVLRSLPVAFCLADCTRGVSGSPEAGWDDVVVLFAKHRKYVTDKYLVIDVEEEFPQMPVRGRKWYP